MLLIADSGSTKCDWRLVAEDKTYQDFKTIGLNPYFHNEQVVENTLRANEQLMAVANKVTAVFFYGAGCSTPLLKRIIDNGLSTVFPRAQVYVDHDLVAAAFAVYQDEPCIACILGTGSNSCHFDGDIVREEVPALAYVLGDEGSGSYFGKKVLADYLYKRLPKSLSDSLRFDLGLTKDIIIDNVYMKPHANVYLASFMRVITSHKQEPYVRNMIREGLERFLEIHVTCYKDYREVPTHFIGSVAFYHEDILREVAVEKGVRIGSIIKKPIEGLYQYHLKHYFQKLPF
jgi:N-acetylglucosamine kinase-like BadF-type ATPase